MAIPTREARAGSIAARAGIMHTVHASRPPRYTETIESHTRKSAPGAGLRAWRMFVVTLGSHVTAISALPLADYAVDQEQTDGQELDPRRARFRRLLRAGGEGRSAALAEASNHR